MIPKYRIIHIKVKGDPCVWQVQERKGLFRWVNSCGRVSSATTAGNTIIDLMGGEDE